MNPLEQLKVTLRYPTREKIAVTALCVPLETIKLFRRQYFPTLFGIAETTELEQSYYPTFYI